MAEAETITKALARKKHDKFATVNPSLLITFANKRGRIWQQRPRLLLPLLFLLRRRQRLERSRQVAHAGTTVVAAVARGCVCLFFGDFDAGASQFADQNPQ